MKKFIFAITLLILYFFSIFLFIGYHELVSFSQKPASVRFEPEIVTIDSGRSFQFITQVLHNRKIIDDPLKFKIYARIQGIDRDVKAGQYLLSPSMSPQEILEILKQGKVYLYRVTIPEGFNFTQIAELLDNANLVNKMDFISTAKDAAFAKDLGIDGDSFEGYLFPDTYFFEKNITSRKIISTMVKHFFDTFHPLWEKRPPEFQLTMHDTVTLASIIEKETGLSEERPLISSVFHNRLKKKMRLQSDPTVIYGIDNFDGNLTRKHLQTPTPHNTYTNHGLPPGPIASPGKASIEATLFPPESPFLYFVSKNDKSHFFSTNYADHKEAVRKYQLNQ